MRVWVAVWTGSTVICGRIGAWISGGWAPRLLGIVLAMLFVKGLPRTTEIMLVLAASWLVTAIALGLRAPAAEQPAEVDEEPKLTPEKVTAAMHQLATPHVQLVPLAEALDSTTGDVRAALQEMGVPVAGGVRMKGRGVSPGVRADDLPPLSPDTAPAPAPVVTSDNNSNNAITVEKREGMSIIRDPADRIRRTLLRKP